MSRIAFALFVLAAGAPAYAQFISLGVKGGIQLDNAFATRYDCCSTASAYDRRYIIGPTAEIRLPLHFSFEVDALYRRNGFEVNTHDPITRESNAFGMRVNDWQIPFLVKWQPGSHAVRPFADGGIVYRHLSGGGSGTETIAAGESLQSFTTTGTTGSASANASGEAVGAGLTFKAAFIRLSPEIRYTYWDQRALNNAGFAASNKNQVDFLLGSTF